MLITYVEGNKIGVYKNGKAELFECDYIKRLEKSRTENKKKKKQYYAETEGEKNVEVLLNCVIPTKDKNKYLYSVSVYEGDKKSCYLYYKHLDGKDNREELFTSFKDYEIKRLTDGPNDELYASCQTHAWTLLIEKISKAGQLEDVDGINYGANPTWNTQGELTYNGNDCGALVGYTRKQEQVWNRRKQQYDTKTYVQKLTTYGNTMSTIKPLYDKEGNLYYIKRERKIEKEDANFFIKALLFPVFIVRDIAKICRKKREEKETAVLRNGAFISGGKKLWINNELVDIKKVAKANRKYEDLGFVPADWTLVKVAPNSNEKVLAYGVADYDITYEDGKTVLVYTNGKRVFRVIDGEFNVEREALFDTELCINLSTFRY